jgi:hypothetical protein
MAKVNCPEVFGNIGSPCPSNVDKGALIGIIPTAAGFSIPIADFVGSAAYDTAIKAGLIYPMMDIKIVENVSDEDRRETYALGQELPLGKAPYKFTFNFHLTEDQHKVLFASNYSAYFKVYSNNYIDGWSTDGITVKPISLGSFEVGKFIPGTDAAASYTQVRVVEKNPREFNLYPIVGYPDWELVDLTGLTNVTIEIIGTPTTTELIVSVNYVKTAMINGSGINPKVPISGLVLTDFSILTTAGAAQPPDSVSETDATGVYTFVDTDLETGNANLVTPPNLTTELLIESVGAEDFTV